ncbi:SDR family oxidoreductase [Echinicola marina]|uniref:SDR family NAD(P)-dependent oxidoreductase n=1 Tax=Echinicola marina TaxID=2859768 RepID=UPI001CF6BA85|nr:SDR family oxidoreductase [Echinicola marina]UCS92588.1 SDR family oxidoreductase [Echinicola marina]
MDLSSLFALNNQVAVITGASKGIGLSIAEFFAAAGAKVVISSRNQQALDEVATRLNDKGYDVIGVACNVSHPDELESLVNKTIEVYGQIDILVNNAGINPFCGPVHETSMELFDKIMAVNVRAPFELSKLCLPHLRKSSNASIINISSIGAITPEPQLGIYSVSKSALHSLTKVCAKEWGNHKVRVNAICPGVVKTKFSQVLWSNDQVMDNIMKRLAIKRMGKVEEIGALALFLASPAASYTTGSIFTVDGGYTS